MRVAKRSSPGSYRRIRMPNASPSPARTRATTSGSGGPSLTVGGTRRGRDSSRFAAGEHFACGVEERGGADARAARCVGERLESGLGAAAIGRVARRIGEPQQDTGCPRVRPGEHVVEDLLAAIGEGRGGGVGAGGIVVAAG